MLLDLGDGLQIDLDTVDQKAIRQTIAHIDREQMEDSLYLFLRNAWRFIDPAPWTDGWPIEAVCEHLQAVADGEIRRLIVNIPPRCAKSSTVSVAFPAWLWAQRFDGPTCGPGTPLLYASYANQLSLRDSVKCRRLIESPWYQERWGERFKLNTDQNTKSRFGNDKGGERLITSIGGAATGEGAQVIICDDPNAANEAFSEATISATIDWWDTTMSTRLNDPRTGAYIIIQQRLAEDDLTGHILEKDDGEWCHLMLPMRYEWQRHSYSSIGWNDPRGCEDDGSPLVVVDDNGLREPINRLAQRMLEDNEGALLWPERFGESEVRSLERSLGTFASAGQLQQRPEPQGGGVIKRAWWQPWDEAEYPPMDFIMATLDTAYTEKTSNDPSAMIVWGVFTSDVTGRPTRMIDKDGRVVSGVRAYVEGAPKLMMMHAWQGHYGFNELCNKVAKTGKQLKIDALMIENKAAGHSIAQEVRRVHSSEDYAVWMYDPKSQDKLSRLYSVQHLWEDGMVFAPDKTWAEEVITQCATFPAAKHDDLVDCCSMALRKLREMGLLQLGAERTAEVEGLKQFRSREPDVWETYTS